MIFKDTRLYELTRFVAITGVGTLLFIGTLYIAEHGGGTVTQFLHHMQAFDDARMQLEAKKSSLLALEHLTSAQADELISTEREIEALMLQDVGKTAMDLYQKVKTYSDVLYTVLAVLGLLLIMLSIVVPRYAELMALLGGGFIILNPILYNFSWWIYVAFAAAVLIILLWQYYLRLVHRDTPAQQARRKFALRVIGVYVIAFAMMHLTAHMQNMLAAYGSADTTQTVGQMFGFTDFDEEKNDLMRADHLSDAQKQRFVMIEKEILKEQLAAEQMHLEQEQQAMGQAKKSDLILLLALSIIVLIALFAPVPLFVTCGCILGAMLVLFYFVLPAVGLAVTAAFAALLFAVVGYRLYRLPRTSM